MSSLLRLHASWLSASWALMRGTSPAALAARARARLRKQQQRQREYAAQMGASAGPEGLGAEATGAEAAKAAPEPPEPGPRVPISALESLLGLAPDPQVRSPERATWLAAPRAIRGPVLSLLSLLSCLVLQPAGAHAERKAVSGAVRPRRRAMRSLWSPSLWGPCCWCPWLRCCRPRAHGRRWRGLPLLQLASWPWGCPGLRRCCATTRLSRL
jgi:hypothetical protein